MRQRVLADALDLPHEARLIVAWRDQATGLSHLRRATDFHTYGLQMELRAYQRAVLLDWRLLEPTADAPWDVLCDSLAGRGVNDLDEALGRMRLRPLHEAMARALSQESLQTLVKLALAPPSDSHADMPSLLRSADKLAQLVKQELAEALVVTDANDLSDPDLSDPDLSVPPDAVETSMSGDAPAASAPKKAADTTRPELLAQLLTATRLPALSQHFSEAWPGAVHIMLPTSANQSVEHVWAPLLAWLLLDLLLPCEMSKPWLAAQCFDELYLRPALAEHLRSLGIETMQTWQIAARVRVLLRWREMYTGSENWTEFFQDGDVAWLTGIHRHEGVEYCRQEDLEAMLCWLALPELVRIAALSGIPQSAQEPMLESIQESGQALSELEAKLARVTEAAAAVGYRLDKLLRLLNPAAAESAPTSRSSAITAPEGSLAPSDLVAESDARSDAASVQAELPENLPKIIDATGVTSPARE